MLKLLIGSVIGALIGSGYMWLRFHLHELPFDDRSSHYTALFALADHDIPQEDFHCANYPDRKTGTVLESIFEQNEIHYLNRIHRACFENRCSISVSNCKPWQSDGCGSTVLYFETVDGVHIDAKSLSCLQIP